MSEPVFIDVPAHQRPLFIRITNGSEPMWWDFPCAAARGGCGGGRTVSEPVFIDVPAHQRPLFIRITNGGEPMWYADMAGQCFYVIAADPQGGNYIVSTHHMRQAIPGGYSFAYVRMEDCEPSTAGPQPEVLT